MIAAQEYYSYKNVFARIERGIPKMKMLIKRKVICEKIEDIDLAEN